MISSSGKKKKKDKWGVRLFRMMKKQVENGYAYQVLEIRKHKRIEQQRVQYLCAAGGMHM